MGQKLPLHMMNAATLRAFAKHLDQQAQAMRYLADDLDRDAERAARRGAALKSYQQGRRSRREVSREEITRMALAMAPAAALSAETGLPLRTVQRIKRDIAAR